MENEIIASTQKLGALLTKVKGTGQVQKSQVADEADMVLEPLMEFMEHSLSRYASQCEKTVLKKLLKVYFYFKLVNCHLSLIVNICIY